MGFEQFDGQWEENARLAADTLEHKPTKGIPNMSMNVMDWGLLEEVSGHAPGAYQEKPEEVYRDFQLACSACKNDQWIPRNPLSMTAQGYDSDTERKPTTGAEEIIVDGMKIDSPEAVAEHMEKFVFPGLKKSAKEIDPDDEAVIGELIQKEVDVQKYFGMNMLKVPYAGFKHFCSLAYGRYGYANYFMAYALFPELMERCFSLQADVAVKRNKQAARAIIDGNLPRLVRLDHDMADSRGTLVDIKSLDQIWFPHFARSIKPLLHADIRLIWHCDGNLMQMVPRLIECGLSGFQGFQYEDGMDYEKICKMTDNDGEPLTIWAGVSVTTTLPHGTKDDVKKQLKWLVDYGPETGLMLGASSSVAPSTNRENVKTLIEGLQHHRKNGRG